MAEIKTTTGTILKMRIKDMTGLRVRTVRELRNSMAIVPAGSEAKVSSAAPRWGLGLDFEPCKTCGIQVHMVKVPPKDVKVMTKGEYNG